MNSAGDDRHTQGDRVPMNYRSPGHNPHYSPMDVAPQPTQGYPTSQPMPIPGASSSSSAHYSQQNFAHSPDESPPPQWEAIETTPPGSSKKVRAKPATDRTPGTTLVPTTRVETIVQAGGANNGLSKEAVYVLTVATEEFIKKLTTVSYVRADIEKRAITGYGDVADTVDKFPEFQFLKETVPRPMPLSKALATRLTLDQQRELYLDKVAEEAAQRLLESRDEVEGNDAPVIHAETISDAKGKGKAKASTANGSTANKSKAGKGKSRASTSAAGGDVPQQTPSVRSERLKNKRAKMEQETADAMDPPNAPNASFAGGVEANDVHRGVSTYSNAMGDGTSISSAPSAKSRSKSAKSAKSAKGNTLSSNVADPEPSLSTSASPAPSGSGQAPASGYKIKIKPRQASSQTVPIAASLSQGVEKVSNSLAYASLYATPTSSAIPVANGSGDVGPPAAKRPRLSLHTGGPSSQQNGVGEPAIPKGNGVTSNKKSKSTTNGSTSDKKGKGSSKKKAASSDRPKQSATSAFAAAPAEVGMETPPPLWTNRPLPAPPSASVSPQRQGASAGVSNMGSPLSPAPPEEGSPNANGHAHTELAVSHDFRSALSPSAAIPGRTIYSHSQQ